jgi:nitroreductase/FMN reductase [NAD(P)H]
MPIDRRPTAGRPWRSAGIYASLAPLPLHEDRTMQTLNQLIEERFGLPTQCGAELPATGPLAALLGRRTCRRYRSEPVPDDLLAVLLAGAQSAPSKSDLQQYAIIVLRDPETRTAIADLMPSMPWVAEAPVFLLFCADARRARRIAAMRGHGFANDNLDSFVNATIDAALAMGACIFAAEASGLGCCPISVVRNHIDAVTELVGLPDGAYPIAGLCVGYPADAGRMSMRLPPSVVVHHDRYDDGRLEAEIEAYDRRRHARQPIAPDKQHHTDRYGVAERCGWSENVARQLSLPERPGFRRFLERHGFALA